MTTRFMMTQELSRSPLPLILRKKSPGHRSGSGQNPCFTYDKEKRQPVIETNLDLDDPDDPESDCCAVPAEPVLVVSNLVKQEANPETQEKNCSESWCLCDKAEKLISQCSGEKYLARCKVIEDLISNWEKNRDVIVVPIYLGL